MFGFRIDESANQDVTRLKSIICLIDYHFHHIVMMKQGRTLINILGRAITFFYKERHVVVLNIVLAP